MEGFVLRLLGDLIKDKSSSHGVEADFQGFELRQEG